MKKTYIIKEQGKGLVENLTPDLAFITLECTKTTD